MLLTENENRHEDEYHHGSGVQYPGETTIHRFKIGAPVILSRVGKERLAMLVPNSKFTVVHSSNLEGEPMYTIEDGMGNRYSAQHFDVELDPDRRD